MLTPIYPIASVPATITVVAPGALQGDVAVPVAPLTIDLAVGFLCDFGNPKYAKLSVAAVVDDETLTVEPLPSDIDAGDEMEIAGSSAGMLLSEDFSKLSAVKQLAMELLAQDLLELVPGYTGDDAERLAFAKVLQINFMVAQKITPKVHKSTSNTTPGNATVYRDRWVNPDAAAIVEKVTGRRQVRFTPPMASV